MESPSPQDGAHFLTKEATFQSSYQGKSKDWMWTLAAHTHHRGDRRGQRVRANRAEQRVAGAAVAECLERGGEQRLGERRLRLPPMLS